jgi:hypothetical protein
MKSAHGKSFFLYSNGIVSPMKAMLVHEIDISDLCGGRLVGSKYSPRELASMYIAIKCCPIRWSGSVFPTRAEGTLNSLGNLFLAYTPLNTGLKLGYLSNRLSISSVCIMHCSQTRLVCFYRFRSRCQILHTGRRR